MGAIAITSFVTFAVIKGIKAEGISIKLASSHSVIDIPQASSIFESEGVRIGMVLAAIPTVSALGGAGFVLMEIS